MKQKALDFMYSTNLWVRQQLANWWLVYRPTNSLQQRPNLYHTQTAAVTISVHCTWHTYGVARALRQLGSLVSWHDITGSTVQAEFARREFGLWMCSHSTVTQCTSGAHAYTTCACSAHRNVANNFILLWISCPTTHKRKLTDWENYRHFWTAS